VWGQALAKVWAQVSALASVLAQGWEQVPASGRALVLVSAPVLAPAWVRAPVWVPAQVSGLELETGLVLASAQSTRRRIAGQPTDSAMAVRQW